MTELEKEQIFNRIKSHISDGWSLEIAMSKENIKMHRTRDAEILLDKRFKECREMYYEAKSLKSKIKSRWKDGYAKNR